MRTERHTSNRRVPEGQSTWATVIQEIGGETHAHSLAERHCALDPQQVHVWAASLDLPEEVLSALESMLCPAERERADRFRFERHRNRFIASRGVLRFLLASYLKVDASAVEFSYGASGKPGLSRSPAKRDLQFNLAHSDDLALVAITEGHSVGVDVEHVRALDDAEELVDRFFSKAEAAVFRTLPSSEKPLAFFNLWTRKEAWLKATGEGIAHSLHLVEVSFLPGTPARLVSSPPDLGTLEDWSLQELAPAPGFVGALAVYASSPKVCCKRLALTAALSPCNNQRVSL